MNLQAAASAASAAELQSLLKQRLRCLLTCAGDTLRAWTVAATGFCLGPRAMYVGPKQCSERSEGVLNILNNIKFLTFRTVAPVLEQHRPRAMCWTTKALCIALLNGAQVWILATIYLARNRCTGNRMIPAAGFTGIVVLRRRLRPELTKAWKECLVCSY